MRAHNIGYVYVMSNDAMPNIYKIGFTTRNPRQRAGELNNTSVPTPFVIEYCIKTYFYKEVESSIHIILKDNRYGKEFFKINLVLAIIKLKEVAFEFGTYDEYYRDEYLKAQVEGRTREYLIEKERQEREKAKQAQEKKELELRQIEIIKREQGHGCGTLLLIVGVFLMVLAGIGSKKAADNLMLLGFILAGAGSIVQSIYNKKRDAPQKEIEKTKIKARSNKTDILYENFIGEINLQNSEYEKKWSKISSKVFFEHFTVGLLLYFLLAYLLHRFQTSESFAAFMVIAIPIIILTRYFIIRREKKSELFSEYKRKVYANKTNSLYQNLEHKIIINCPRCRQKLRVPGHKVVTAKCPKCSLKFPTNT